MAGLKYLSGAFVRFVVLLVVVLIAGCGRPPELIGVDNPEVPVASVENASKRKVFIATTRQETETVGAFFSAARAPELGLASVEVSIPPTHEVGNLERPKRLPPDPRTEFAIVDPVVYKNDNAFISELNAELRKRPRGQRKILFFIHGYNNTTSDAVLRLAQFAEDSEYNGVTVLFDWASAASTTRYVYDLNSALIARRQVFEISNVLGRTNAETYDIFAHSMGSFLLMEAYRDSVLSGRFNNLRRLDSVILASPDVDMDLFRAQLDQIGTKRLDRFFVLLSEDDSALKVSRRIAGGVPRVGASNIDELAELGVIAIDLSKVQDSKSGSHSKFAGSPEVVQLIGNGLNSTGGLDASGRPRILDDFVDGLPIRIAF